MEPEKKPRLVISGGALVFLLLLACFLIYYNPITAASDLLAYINAALSGFSGVGRSPVSRVMNDMRSMATGIESYYVDHDSYPPTRPFTEMSLSASESLRKSGERLTTVEAGKGGVLSGLTTPVAYLGAVPTDPFSAPPQRRLVYSGRFFTHSWNQGRAPFAYYADAGGWILISPGMDLKYDLDPARDYDSSMTQPSAKLLMKAYDPTNGSESAGDIFRVKQ
jgi:hypothetical protein